MSLALTLYPIEAKTSSNFVRLVFSAPATKNSATGWNVGGVASSRYSEMAALFEQDTSTFSSSALPTGIPNTQDSFASDGPLSGKISAGNWDLALVLQSVTVASGGQSGAPRVRFFRGPNASGSGATAIDVTQQMSTITLSAINTPQTSTLSYNPGDIVLNNEYFFIQTAWVTTNTVVPLNSDVMFQWGSGCRFIMPSWTPLPDIQGTPTGGSCGV